MASYLRVNPRATPEKIQQYREANGLIGSMPEQYFRWLGHFVTGDWGHSIKGNRPVWPEMKNALANTLVLGIAAVFVGVTVGLRIGILAALRPYSKFDTAATTGAFVGHLDPAVRVGRAAPAALRRVPDEVAGPVETVPAHVRRLSARPVRASTPFCAPSI